MLRARGAYAGKRDDQLLGSLVPGYRDVKIYSYRGANVDQGKKFIAKSTTCKNGCTVTLYTANAGAFAIQAQVVQYNMKQIGMNVTLIPAEKIATENLSQYGTIILGVRAYDTQKDLVANNKKLLDFVSNGGTLIVQNNNSVGDFNSGHFTPYDAELSRARVSVEEALVQILAPDDPVLHYPNEISQKDFDRWVQERGLYFMDKWDDHFKPLLSCHDPGEPDQKGGLLVAKYGKGTYIYTGYAFFRQLPAGVPGAIRLFVNLVSAGKTAAGGEL